MQLEVERFNAWEQCGRVQALLARQQKALVDSLGYVFMQHCTPST